MTSRNSIHHTAIIEDTVRLGVGNFIGPFVVIQGNVTIGDNNWIGPHSVIGSPADHSHFHSQGEKPAVVFGAVTIGSRCIIHDHVSVHSPTTDNTVIESEVYVCSGAYLGHDVFLGHGATISPRAALGGHVYVGHGATIGMGSSVHQRRIIGPLSMIGMQSSVIENVQPCAVVAGNPACFIKQNQVALDRLDLGDGPWREQLSRPFGSWDLALFPVKLREIIESFQYQTRGK